MKNEVLDDLTKEVFEALGTASMCWSETPKGEFESTRAKEIGEALMIKIKEALFIKSSLTFESALQQLKLGAKVQRAGWNGKGMYVVRQKGYPDGIAINKNTAEATGVPEGTVCKFTPYLMIKSVDNSFTPWVPSQTDLLAEDWYILLE